MRSNSRVGSYAYTNASVAKHAPSTVTPTSGTAQVFSYDANGNMLVGLDGKILAYDCEDRPLSVTYLGKKTCYIYGADGTRRKKIENYTPAQSCTAPTPAQIATAYLGSVEIRNYGQGAAEELLLYPHATIRISKTKDSGGVIITGISTLQRDAQGTVYAVTTAAGVRAERTLYRPFGEATKTTYDLATAPESKGYIGERFDADAGLQYLNARYYDPKLGMFLQPDWWEVTKAGVGTNRFAYAGNDPVNGTDASGYSTCGVFRR